MLIPKTHFYVQAWAGQILGSDEVDVKGMPSLLRRRISPMGKEALALASALPSLDAARFVFSSRHGEFSCTLSILKQIAKKEPLSPADFSLSVHHALISLLSIAHKNRNGHTAVSGGEESFGLGLVEAIACLHEKPEEPVLLLHCDDLLPDDYAVYNEECSEPVVLALLLGSEKGAEYSFDVTPARGKQPITSLSSDFLSFIQGQKSKASTQTTKHLWQWEQHGVR